jgi:hypothetical protein
MQRYSLSQVIEGFVLIDLNIDHIKYRLNFLSEREEHRDKIKDLVRQTFADLLNKYQEYCKAAQLCIAYPSILTVSALYYFFNESLIFPFEEIIKSGRADPEGLKLTKELILGECRFKVSKPPRKNSNGHASVSRCSYYWVPKTTSVFLRYLL